MLPVFVVSLKTDVEKREIISKKLNELEIEYEFIDAVYGKSLSDDYCSSLIPKGKLEGRGFLPTRGEIGCSFSHVSIFNKMQNLNSEWACILEDDAILDENFSIFFKTLNQNQFDSNILYILGGQDGLEPSKYIATSLFKSVEIGKQIFYKVNNTEKYVNRTCCYIINKKSACKILELFNKNFYLADDWYSFKKAGAYESIYISQFVSHPLDLTMSSIEFERQAGRGPLLNKPKSHIYRAFKKIYFFGLILSTKIKRFY